MDRRKDGSLFIGPFQPQQGVEKFVCTEETMLDIFLESKWGLPRKKFHCIWYFISVNLSRGQLISKISITFFTNVLFKKLVSAFFLLFLKEKCVSWLFQTKYFFKNCKLQLFYLSMVSWTFIFTWDTTCCMPF